MTTTLLSAKLVRAEHVLTFDIRAIPQGWQAIEGQDQQVVREQRYADWHRVERVLGYYTRAIADLVEAGWEHAS